MLEGVCDQSIRCGRKDGIRWGWVWVVGLQHARLCGPLLSRVCFCVCVCVVGALRNQWRERWGLVHILKKSLAPAWKNAQERMCVSGRTVIKAPVLRIVGPSLIALDITFRNFE